MNGNFRTLIYLLIVGLIIYIVYQVIQRGELVSRKEVVRSKNEDGQVKVKRSITEEYQKNQ